MEASCLPDREAGLQLHRLDTSNGRIWFRRFLYWPSWSRLSAFYFWFEHLSCLPSMSLIALAIAAIVALAAWCLSSDRHGAGITLWDVSGAYAFIGFAAGMLSDPQQVLEF